MTIYEDQKIDADTFSRVFKSNCDSDELVFHRDKRDREILSCLNEGNWKLQMDNEIPKTITAGMFIPKEVYHRLVKGDGDLQVVIKESN